MTYFYFIHLRMKEFYYFILTQEFKNTVNLCVQVYFLFDYENEKNILKIKKSYLMYT